MRPVQFLLTHLEATHVCKLLVSKPILVSQGKRISALTCAFLISRSLVSKVGPSLIGNKRLFSTPIQVSLQTPFPIGVGNGWFESKQRGTDLEPKLLGVGKHMPKPKFCLLLAS
jgi:hypothetical protein